MRYLCLLLSVMTLAFAAAPGESQSARVPEVLNGSWRCTVSPDAARSTAMRAFAPRLESIPALFRGWVQNRIESRIHPPGRIDIDLTGDRIRVTNYGERRIVVDTPLGGSTTIRNADGERLRVTQRLRDGWLEQTFQGENALIQRLLSTEPDGQTMHTDVTLTVERLGAPVRWRLDYRHP